MTNDLNDLKTAHKEKKLKPIFISQKNSNNTSFTS